MHGSNISNKLLLSINLRHQSDFEPIKGGHVIHSGHHLYYRFLTSLYTDTICTIESSGVTDDDHDGDEGVSLHHFRYYLSKV